MMTLWTTTTTRPWPERLGLHKVTRTQRTKRRTGARSRGERREPGQGAEGGEARRWRRAALAASMGNRAGRDGRTRTSAPRQGARHVRERGGEVGGGLQFTRGVVRACACVPSHSQ